MTIDSGNFFSSLAARFRKLPPDQRTNWWVLIGLVAALLATLLAIWLYQAWKEREKPYYEIQGYRVATHRSLNSFLREGDNRRRFGQLARYLRRQGVGDITAPENLLRQGTDWLDIGQPPFAIPPQEQWQNMVPTLEVIRDHVVPAIGPVDILSAYRNDEYNRRAGGSRGSKHKVFCGVDLVPRSNIGRGELIEELRAMHSRLGSESKVGLGIYSGLRFHIDTCGYRSW